MKLTRKQRRFVEEYLVDLNASAAAQRAGYSVKTAKQQGHELLAHAGVQAAIEAAQRERSERTGITADRVLVELAKIALADIRKAVVWRSNVQQVGDDPDTGEPALRSFNEVVLVDSDKIDDATAAAIVEVSQTKDGALKIKLADKRAALVDLGRHFGLFPTRTEVTGKDGGPITVRRIEDMSDDELLVIAAGTGGAGDTAAP